MNFNCKISPHPNSFWFTGMKWRIQCKIISHPFKKLLCFIVNIKNIWRVNTHKAKLYHIYTLITPSSCKYVSNIFNFHLPISTHKTSKMPKLRGLNILSVTVKSIKSSTWLIQKWNVESIISITVPFRDR